MSLITYNPSLFEEVFNHRIYKSQIVVRVSACLEDVFTPKQSWTKVDSESADYVQDLSMLPYVVQSDKVMTFMLNKLNSVLLLLIKQGIGEINDEDGKVVSTMQIDFMKNNLSNKEAFEAELGRFLTLLCICRQKVVQPGDSAYNEIIDMLRSGAKEKEMKNNLFVRNIQRFFPNPIDIRAVGHNVIFNYRGRDISVKVKHCIKMEQEATVFKIWCDTDPIEVYSEDYLAFILPNNYIYVFQNDKFKIRNLSGQQILDTTADAGVAFFLPRDILFDYKKVF